MVARWVTAAAALVLLFIGWQFLVRKPQAAPDFQSQLAELDWLDVIAMLESEDIDLSAEELLSAG